MIVKPAPGRAVRDPRSMALLTEDGRDVNERDPFWARRLRDKDVVEATGDTQPVQKPAAREA
jgi:hypothetical protein